MAKTITLSSAFLKNFLGKAPDWYKLTIVGFLIINPIIFSIDPFIAGWLLVVEFIFTLAMALKCYPLQPGGLLAIEAVGRRHLLYEAVVAVYFHQNLAGDPF